MDSHLVIPYFYQYAVGSIVFFGGLAVAHQAGALDWKSRETRWTVAILVAGMALYATVHGLLQFVLPFVGE